MKISIDIENFRELYDLFYTPLCEYLNFYTKDKYIIEDIIQDVFLKLWENKDHIEISYIKTYLFHSARNLILNHLRNEGNRSLLLEKWFHEQVKSRDIEDNSFDVNTLFDAVQEAIEILPERCKKIFLLSKKEGMTYKQIANTMEISVKTVENQIGIALKKIKTYLHSKYKYLIPLIILAYISAYFSGFIWGT